MLEVRTPAVANLFYPRDKDILENTIKTYLAKAPLYSYKPEGLISPHAGYMYSGIVAAVSYKQLLNLDLEKHHTFLLIGPSHHVYLQGISFGYYDFWQTPLGMVKVAKEKIAEFVKSKPNFPLTLNTLPHRKEHSLEVQVPFLQVIAKNFDIIPVVYGDIESDYIKEIIEFFKDEKTVVIISSDLSHYYPDKVAREIDSYCHLAVEKLDERFLQYCEACGKTGIEAMIKYAKEKGLKSKVLEYKTSGDTGGDYSSVVGYASYIFYK
ncbi:MAG: AmmeMemoRadiSam system protein B [Sulfurihydrogenibium sp.]|uniref:MEMO1 family protein ENO34_01160 n=1 Tax=Sulfurihydrogenibium azorense TaxID=309806 RepID=A0A832DQC9_9AQUI|nr:MAG: AmmeMemoRadiSam system protein B [Sulfurihydrogenibium sp.]HEV08989.1 AmmeMemoRadiSam system protein B [Sulfurihydrogenibium azorense]